jgi:hypothetical protein
VPQTGDGQASNRLLDWLDDKDQLVVGGESRHAKYRARSLKQG